MDEQVFHYFKWILQVNERGLKLLVDMYNAGFLCDHCARALEAVESMAAD